jgi:hypothetical protein
MEPLANEARDHPRRRRLVLMVAGLAACVVALGLWLWSDGDGGPVSSPATGCGSGCTAAAVPSPLVAHPCALLTDGAIANVFKDQVAYRVAEKAPDECTWAGPPFPGYGHKQVTVGLAAAITREQFAQSASSWLVPGNVPGTLRRVPAGRVRAVGDIAYEVNNGADLAVWYRGTVIYIDSVFVSSPLQAEKRLARRIIARLAAERRAAERT